MLSSTSPRGVAPPVSDDCAPIGRTDVADRSSAATSDFRCGRGEAGGEAAGEVRGVLEKRREHICVVFDTRG